MFLQRGGGEGGLRSILKQQGENGKSGRKEISFSEEVLGGYVASYVVKSLTNNFK